MSATVVTLPTRAAAREAAVIPDRAEYINRLREILSALEADDQALFESRLNQLMRLREEGLFVNLAKLTRELHQAVRELNFDDRLQQLAGSEIPDACVRLDYVVKLGEDAAHRTLDLVDASRTLLTRLADDASRLGDARRRLQLGGDSAARGSAIGSGIVEELEHAERLMHEVSSGVRLNLSSISQAQEYQDLSGQVIRRVIALVHNIEGALITLLKATNEGLKPSAAIAPAAVANGELAGPAIPGLAQGSASQQDADALLAELGF